MFGPSRLCTTLAQTGIWLCLFALLVSCQSETKAPTGLDSLSLPVTYEFVAEQSAVLPGKNSTDPYDDRSHAKDGVDSSDSLGAFAVVATWGGNAYYTGGKYNDNDWPVEIGRIKGTAASVRAIRIEPAQHKATKFAATKHALFFRVDEAVESKLYELQDGALKLLATLKMSSEDAGQWRRVGDFHLAGMSAERILVVAPASISLGPFRSLSESVEGAKLSEGPLGNHFQLRVTTPQAPVDSLKVYKAGPGEHANRYGQNRRFWPVQREQGHGVIWQAPASGTSYVTWLSADLVDATSASLPLPDDMVLAGAVSDGAGVLFALMIEPSSKELTTRTVKIFRMGASAAGVELQAEQALDAAKKKLNITSFGSIESASNQVAMQYSEGKIGLFVARKMHKASDGLNHQGAISLVIDAETLTLMKNHGQSSGHSFESFLTVGPEGRFVGVDLGDNYPRGVHLHRFDEQGRKSRVVYTFKTKHGTKAQNPAGKTFPKYDGVQSDKALYQWSNDNSTYTELAGVVSTSKGLLVVFASEADQLDNGKATSLHNGPRNVASVCIRADFEAASKGKNSAWVTDDLVVSSSDYTMEGGYYSFGGKWLEQRNVGVNWLTAYDDKESNASRLKVVKSASEATWVVWERWSAKSYIETFAMSLNDDGSLKQAAHSLGKQLRLGRREDPVVTAAGVWFVRGDGAGLVLDLIKP
ncbi:MAG TPA: hypothetical protein DCQ06_07810 [Myxococcales bacterium]|nr:hypothetical protein [Myxococcales bacterium]HAN31488.1 hypothetical protein [Myxococcales bacterium]